VCGCWCHDGAFQLNQLARRVGHPALNDIGAIAVPSAATDGSPMGTGIPQHG
jgi:hypothetical protein